MYWTKSGGGVFKADMDGSNAAVIVPGLSDPVGIAIDLGSLRLFWVEYNGNRVRSIG